MTAELKRRVRERAQMGFIRTEQIERWQEAHGGFPWANVGRNHPHYGMSQAEHLETKGRQE